MKNTNRREFLRKSAMSIAGLTIVPSVVLGNRVGQTAPSDKLNIAGIGVGDKGGVNLRNMSSENIVALCDVDWAFAKKTFDGFPNAKTFWDYREMYDKIGKSIDAVVIATPDHAHAMIAADAMTMGKHVYLQKPLTHSVYESRLMAKLAAKYNIVSQMGNEGASTSSFRLISDVIWAGELGEVTRIEAFTNRPIWPQGIIRPKDVHPVPDTLRWDLYVGPAEMRPFNKVYHPFRWRGWWDFGTGALGDMACHILHPVYHALHLNAPDTIQATSTALMDNTAPSAESVRYTFPARGKIGNVNYPAMLLDWMDGGLKPRIPEGMPNGRKLSDGGVIYYGTKDTLVAAAGSPFLLSGREIKVPSQSREITVSHELDWVRACKENPANRVKPVSDFAETGPLNEMIVAGVAAVRLQGLGKALQWDAKNMAFTNIDPGETIRFMTKNGYALENGVYDFGNAWTEPVNAQQFAQELIKHTYRNGFKLVDMPV